MRISTYEWFTYTEHKHKKSCVTDWGRKDFLGVRDRVVGNWVNWRTKGPVYNPCRLEQNHPRTSRPSFITVTNGGAVPFLGGQCEYMINHGGLLGVLAALSTWTSSPQLASLQTSSAAFNINLTLLFYIEIMVNMEHRILIQLLLFFQTTHYWPYVHHSLRIFPPKNWFLQTKF